MCESGVTVSEPARVCEPGVTMSEPAGVCDSGMDLSPLCASPECDEIEIEPERARECKSGMKLSGLFEPPCVRVPHGSALVARNTKRHMSALVCNSEKNMPRPAGSQHWYADSGSSATVTNDCHLMYNVRRLPPDEQYIRIGDVNLISVVAIGTIDLKFHQLGTNGKPEDFCVSVEAHYVPGCGFNLFSVWKVSHKHEVIINPQGTHLLNRRLLRLN